MIDFGSSSPHPEYCQKFGCPGCATVREAMAKHMKNSNSFLCEMDRNWDDIAQKGSGRVDETQKGAGKKK